MKKFYSFASALLLAGALVGGLASCNGGKQGTAVAPFAANDSLRLPIAYINVDSLLVNYDFAKDLNEELIKQTEDARASINGKAQALDKEVQEFQRKIQTNAFLSEDRAKSEANRLQSKKEELDQLSLDLQMPVQRHKRYQGFCLADCRADRKHRHVVNDSLARCADLHV